MVADRYKSTIQLQAGAAVPDRDRASRHQGPRGRLQYQERHATPPPAKADEAPPEAPKKKGFGLSKLVSGGGSETKSAQVVGSGGARGLDPEKDAKGGGNPAVVVVKVTPADLQAFKTAGSLT